MTTTTQTQRYELEDSNGRPVAFTGRMLAHASSDDGQKERWLEYRVFRTEGGTYVLEIVGETNVPGEVVRTRAKVLGTARELLDALHSKNDQGERYLTYTARDAIAEACENDPDLDDAWRARTVYLP